MIISKVHLQIKIIIFYNTECCIKNNITSFYEINRCYNELCMVSYLCGDISYTSLCYKSYSCLGSFSIILSILNMIYLQFSNSVFFPDYKYQKLSITFSNVNTHLNCANTVIIIICTVFHVPRESLLPRMLPSRVVVTRLCLDRACVVSV